MFGKLLSAIGIICIAVCMIVVTPLLWPVMIMYGVQYLVNQILPEYRRSDLQEIGLLGFKALCVIAQSVWGSYLFIVLVMTIVEWMLPVG